MTNETERELYRVLRKLMNSRWLSIDDSANRTKEAVLLRIEASSIMKEHEKRKRIYECDSLM